MDFSPSHASNLKISPREEAVRKSKKRTPNPCDGLIPLSFLFSMRFELCLKLCVWVILICLKSYSWRRKGYSELDFASVRLSVAVRKYLTEEKKNERKRVYFSLQFQSPAVSVLRSRASWDAGQRWPAKKHKERASVPKDFLPPLSIASHAAGCGLMIPT